MLEYAKIRNASLDRTDLEEIISIYNNVPIIELMSDSELIKSVTPNLRNLIQKSLKMIKTFPLKI